MEPGEIIEEFVAKDGRKFTLRAPEISDTKGYLSFINALVEEDAPIMLNLKQDYMSEVAYVESKIRNMLNGSEIPVVATFEGRIAGDASILRKNGRERDNGVLGIAIAKDFRNIGLGGKMISLLLEIAKKNRMRMVELAVYANNPGAIHLYKKLGFAEIGKLPKAGLFGSNYVDEILMVKEL
ncbi:MAG: GNAT family N-acetyltransferase [Candidatus Micrarchaeia archaeon]|jgi:ribosomal protein S18 acetylase RimI-like enzyme